MRENIHRSPDASAPAASPFDKRLAQLPESVRPLMPPESAEYLGRTNDMHCNPDTSGGSKFVPAVEGGVDDILGVVEKMGADELARRVAAREDDREPLMAAGAPENAFLPATKGPGAPEGLPEALYFKVDGIRGTVGILQLSELDPTTRVDVLQEKEGVPLSYSAHTDSMDALPRTDFATIIIGRGGDGKDAVWTIHPGAPIRPTVIEGFEHGQTVTVQELLDAGVSTYSYIKLLPPEKASE